MDDATEKKILSTFDATMIVEGQWELAGVEPSDEAFIEAAQYLIDTGLCWQLQGYFGRTCQALIDAGHCTPAKAA